jgi:hypothetical protein
MKLVCIDDKILRKDIGGHDYLKKEDFLEVGKVYDLPYLDYDRYVSSSYIRFWFDDKTEYGSHSLIFSKEKFVTLEEFRERQINKLGI